MGCCHDREERGPGQYQRKNHRRVILKRDYDLDTMKDQETMIIKEHSDISMSIEITEPDDEKYLRAQLEVYKVNGEWGQIAKMISNRTEITEAKIYISWAEKPKTIGSLAIAYLCKECKNDPKAIAPYVEKDLPLLLASIKMGTDDLRENSLLLLFYFVDVASEESITKLLKLNIFNALVRWFLCSKAELRHISADICAKIYRGRRAAQEAFLNEQGAFKLVQLIAWSSDQEDVLLDLLGYLIDLMQDENDDPVLENIGKVHECMVWDIIRNIDTTEKSQELMEQLDAVIRLLSFQGGYS
ncbi:unnamed protein product [Blepharisma stoltei]|uniref:Uncharacterized protein n=1 Tax=Blepharisma stoltei TaxID=1481888 RepID=A0AAU9JWV7_9CILI|nr:unnamed protein product [Blepharisma stoltei]